MAEWKILMADDDPEDRTILQEAISELVSDEVLRFATNGEEALELLELSAAVDHRPCLIVLDLNMPRLNGSQTLAAIKKDDRFRDIPVVIYSTSINPLERERCLMLGAHSYRVKPVSYKESKDIARSFLEFCDIATKA